MQEKINAYRDVLVHRAQLALQILQKMDELVALRDQCKAVEAKHFVAVDELKAASPDLRFGVGHPLQLLGSTLAATVEVERIYAASIFQIAERTPSRQALKGLIAELPKDIVRAQGDL